MANEIKTIALDLLVSSVLKSDNPREEMKKLLSKAYLRGYDDCTKDMMKALKRYEAE